MKRIFSIIFCFVFIFSYAQKEVKKKEMEDFKLNKIYEKVKTYNEQPQYWLFLHSNNCSYIVTLDDMPIYTDYNDGSMKSLSVPLNNFILESKKHELNVLILPKIDENYNVEHFLANDFSLNIKVSRTQNKKEDIVFDKKISNSEENQSLKQVIIAFESNVPYMLKGWTNSIDLTKQDKKDLEKEVVSFYKEMIDDYKNQKIQNIERKYYKRQIENAQSFYLFKKEDSEKLISEINKDVYKEQNFSLDNYKLAFYGNGKVVGLIRTDGEFLGKSAFLGLTDEDFYIYSLLLHRPTVDAELEVIR